MTNTSDDNNGTVQSGPSGVNYFTGGTGSLRGAINYAQNFMSGNANNTSMAIILSPSTYSLSSSYGQLVADLNAGETLTIVPQSGAATITAKSQSRDFYVQGSGSLVLQGLTITGGSNSSQGGGIYQAAGTLTLNDVKVTGNYAGQGGTAVDNFSPTAGRYYNGQNGTAGASGYGGGIYLNGGTLNLLSNSSIAGNTVQGQNGGAGQKGGEDVGSSTSTGQNGGNGGNGGNALGGGLYQAAGTLVSPVGASTIEDNTAEPGTGGAAGASGEVTDGAWPGKPGSTGTNGTGSANYDRVGGATVFTANATESALSVSGGLYQSSGGLSIASTNIPVVQAESSGATSPISGVSVELHAADGTLITTTTTDSTGRYRFSTDFSGMGYVQLEPIPIFNAVAKGAEIADGATSAIDPNTLKSGVVQFLAGTPVNGNLSFALAPIARSAHVGGNSLTVSPSSGGAGAVARPDHAEELRSRIHGGVL